MPKTVITVISRDLSGVAEDLRNLSVLFSLFAVKRMDPGIQQYDYEHIRVEHTEAFRDHVPRELPVQQKYTIYALFTYNLRGGPDMQGKMYMEVKGLDKEEAEREMRIQIRKKYPTARNFEMTHTDKVPIFQHR